jgi:hypothetical protein
MMFVMHAAENEPEIYCARLARPEGDSGYEFLPRVLYRPVLKLIRGGHILCATSGGNGSEDCSFRNGTWDHILHTSRGPIDLAGKPLESYTVRRGDVDAWYWHENVPASRGEDEGTPDEGIWPGNYENQTFDWPHCQYALEEDVEPVEHPRPTLPMTPA